MSLWFLHCKGWDVLNIEIFRNHFKLNFSVLFFFLGGTGVWTQDSALEKRALTPPAHFALVILEMWSHFLSRLAGNKILLFIVPTVTGMTDVWYQAHLFSWGGVSWPFFARLDWNCTPPDLSLPCSLGWQACTMAPSYWLRLDPMNYLPRLALNCSTTWATPPALFSWWVFSR
jgi:hypothetical protein